MNVVKSIDKLDFILICRYSVVLMMHSCRRDSLKTRKNASIFVMQFKGVN